MKQRWRRANRSKKQECWFFVSVCLCVINYLIRCSSNPASCVDPLFTAV